MEILEVPRRPEVARLFASTLPDRDPAAIVAMLQSAETVEPQENPRIARDPKDDKFLAAATAAGASYLVSEDRDLLDLGSHAGVTIIDAAAFLQSAWTGSRPRERGLSPAASHLPPLR